MRVRTGYSFKTAFGHLPDVLDRIIEIGWSFAPIADRTSTFGFTRWTKAAKAANLRPIYGVELAVVPRLGEKKPPVDYWTFFATSRLRDLHEAIATATGNAGAEPSLTYSQALALPGLIRIAGERVLLDEVDPASPDFFIALSPATPKGLIRRGSERGFAFLASPDPYYPREDDLETYRVAIGRRSGTQTYPRHIMSDAELREWFAEEEVDPDLVAAAFDNRDRAVAACDVTMRSATLLVPEKPKTLREMCVEAAPRLSIDLSDPVYAERLDRELRLIDEKAFEDYFYILADLIQWAKQRMVVGPARGSSCGSLVCYLLGITAIDPIPFGLIFERFIDVNRMDLPDIDVDFSDRLRHLVFEYAEEKYGRDRVARLGTVGVFKARSALKQAGSSLHIPTWRTDKLADSIIERSSGDSRVMNSLEDTLNDTDAGRALIREHPEMAIAAKLEGHPAVASQHAAGLLLTAEPIAEYVAMDRRTRAAWCDKKDAEALNLLKIDALGLTQLSIFERTLELVGEKPSSAFFDTIPFDDQAVFDLLNAKRYSGVFQFTGTALRSLAGQIHFERLDDLIAMSALARPGPLASGGTEAWIARRNGAPIPPARHPLLAELTKETYGVVVYQETVMRITRELGKFSWADTARIRKLMSGRMGVELFEAFWEKFRAGAIENGMPENVARIVWDEINTFGSWAFNKSHSVAYGVVSYWSCWLKAHYPVAFAAATLDAETDPAKQLSMLRELRAEGIPYVPVDPDHSTERWSIAGTGKDTRLVGPLTAIRGIGPVKVRKILDARAAGEPLSPSIMKQLQTAKTPLDSLEPIADRIKELHPDLTKINIFTEPTPIRDVQPGIKGEVVVLAMIKTIAPRDENDAQKVQSRNGRRLTGPTLALNIFATDDTDEILCRVDRFNFERLGRKVLEEGRAGKSLYAIKGSCPADFRMIRISAIRYLGEVA